MAHIRYRSPTVAIEVCLLFNFAVVFIFNVFPFPPSKAHSLDVVSLIGKTQLIIRLRFEFVFCVMEGDRDAPCANRQHRPNLLRL